MSRMNKQQSSATLICDYSLNNLNMLMMANDQQPGPMSNTELNSMQTSEYKGSPDTKFFAKLDDEEENVDFMQMFNHYQKARPHQNMYGQRQQPHTQPTVDYYHHQSSGGGHHEQNHSERIQNQQRAAQMMHLQDGHARGAALRPPPTAGKGIKKFNMRPSSATVAGTAGRFLSNHQMKTAYGGMHFGGAGSQGNNLVDQTSHSYQQPGNHPMSAANTNSIGKLGFGANSQHGSNRNVGIGMNNAKPTSAMLKKKKTPIRPMSAAKNQMRPAPQLQSVTTFTFQKAKQNQNQRSFVPESLKNTDKERLYEDKINLKKQLNEYMKENQVLKTQVQNHHNIIKKKDDTIQGMMRQLFHHPSASVSSQNMDNFLSEFQKREIQHKQELRTPLAQQAAPVAVSNTGVVQTLKQKLKEVNELINQRDRELADLKQTLKFTKIKEYEAELALNVQESQRLRYLLEREMQKPKVDPRLVQGLRQQIAQYQELIQNFQTNQSLQQENYDKLNKKLIAQIKKNSKQKESKKRLMEKNKRLERKVEILTSKVQSGQFQQQTQQQQNYQAKERPITNTQMMKLQKQFQQKFDQQNNFIERLLIKMQNSGVEMTEEELINLQQESMQDGQVIEEEEEQPRGMDLIVTFGGAGSKNSNTRQISDAYFVNFDQLKQTLQQEFSIGEDFYIKYVNEDGKALELTGNNFDHLKTLSTMNQIRLEIELLNQEEEQSSNYEEDFDEDIQEYQEGVTEEEIEDSMKEMKYILMIKQIKCEQALKYILHDLRDSKGKKQKMISIQTMKERLREKIGFKVDTCLQIARYLIEKPDKDNQVVVMKNHEEDCQASRRDILKVFTSFECMRNYNHIDDEQLKRIHKIMNDKYYKRCNEMSKKIKLQSKKSLVPIQDVFKAFESFYGDTFMDDEDEKEIIEYLAMYFSDSLKEVKYEDLFEAIEEDDFDFEDNRSRWNKKPEDFEASSDGDEMYSEPSVNNKDGNINHSTAEDFDQNVLLEKVDEILQQIVSLLPEKNKVMTLTQWMMPYLHQVYDQSIQRDFLIILEQDFIAYLKGSGQNQLGLQLDESHITCLMHLLGQEDDASNQQYIHFDEFIELVKTYMKKELIMKQSKSLGIHYEILGQQSVEFLFKIRSSLMQDNNINENSGDEEDLMQRQNKTVEASIRELFNRIILNKNIQLKQGEASSTVEVMDFDEMLGLLFQMLSIPCPSAKAQEELKYLLCLDFKYLEMVMLVKFSKVMHDLDYISIDLLRQAKDENLDDDRKSELNRLKRIRDNQLGQLKKMQAEREVVPKTGQFVIEEEVGMSNAKAAEKKRKRPDDKKQLLSKKLGSNIRSVNNKKSPNEDEMKAIQASNPKYRPSDFEDIDVDVDLDLVNKDDDYEEEEFIQDDIPIDEDDDEEGIISDHFEHINSKPQTAIIKSTEHGDFKQVITNQSPSDEQMISVGHSDDMEESRKMIVKNSSRQMIPDLQVEDQISDRFEEEGPAGEIEESEPLPDVFAGADEIIRNEEDEMSEEDEEEGSGSNSSSSSSSSSNEEEEEENYEDEQQEEVQMDDEMDKVLRAQESRSKQLEDSGVQPGAEEYEDVYDNAEDDPVSGDMEDQEEYDEEEDEYNNAIEQSQKSRQLFKDEGIHSEAQPSIKQSKGGFSGHFNEPSEQSSRKSKYSDVMRSQQYSQKKPLDEQRQSNQSRYTDSHKQSDKYSEAQEEYKQPSINSKSQKQSSERYSEQQPSVRSSQNKPSVREPSAREAYSIRQTQSHHGSQQEGIMFHPAEEKNAFSAPSSSSRQEKSQSEQEYYSEEKSNKSRTSKHLAEDSYQDEFAAQQSQRSSKKSFKPPQSSSSRRSPIAQDFQAPDEEIDDFAVEVPSHHEEVRKSVQQHFGNFVGSNSDQQENSVQVVEDNYYVEDFEDDDMEQSNYNQKESRGKLRNDSHRQSHQSGISKASKKSKSYDDDDYEF